MRGMQILTDSGLKSVQTRAHAKWALAGIEQGHTVRQSAGRLRMVDSSNGRIRTTSYLSLYRENPWVYASINLLSRGFARLPTRVWKLDREGDREPVRGNGPLTQGAPDAGQRLDRILRKPNPDQSGHELWLSLAVDYGIFHNALLKIGRNTTTNAIERLDRIPWHKVSVILGEDEPILGYEIHGSKGISDVLSPDDVVHFGRGDDPTSPLGMSPLVPLAKSTGLYDAIGRFLTHFFRNQARPSGNLKLPPGIDESVLEFVRDQMDDIYASPENAGRPMVTTGDWQSLTTEPEHSQVVELSHLSREEVAAVLQVPQALLGIASAGGETKSNVGELREHYYRDVVGPMAKRFEDDLTAQLLPRSTGWRDLVVEFDMSEMLRPDLQARATAYRSLRYIYSTNELRKREGLPPLDDPRADTVWLPGAEVPLIPETLEDLEQPDEPEPNPDGSAGPGGDPADEPAG